MAHASVLGNPQKISPSFTHPGRSRKKTEQLRQAFDEIGVSFASLEVAIKGNLTIQPPANDIPPLEIRP